ncbi:hypothetical protein [Paraburkholderia sp. BR14320]|uniref:hypothetical protein n=1 Tax=unclassified Paraburkholderia TaxID=2615204 RepID=UPI0034CE1001
MNGLFASVPCALYIAFKMPAYEASPESTCLKILRSHIKEHDVWGHFRFAPKVCCFDQLTNLEIHAQCAQIVRSVSKHLPASEAATIRARYGLTEFEDVDGRRRYAFSEDRADAIKSLSRYFRTVYDALSEAECDLLVARVFADERSTTPITLRSIAAACGRSHVHYHNYYHAIDDRIYQFEVRALDILTDVFANRGASNGVPVVDAADENYQQG